MLSFAKTRALAEAIGASSPGGLVEGLDPGVARGAAWSSNPPGEPVRRCW